ncbi:MAG: linear amide C-N hydrolase [Clostridia bacterium]|nr:linear amide C-N hydrolase [Clostridia bacterium]
MITPNENITELEDGFSAVRYEGDDLFEKFLSDGGASSDAAVAEFLKNNISGISDLEFNASSFGCSAVSAQNSEGERLFGRNFDWQECEALIVVSKPSSGYASISTVNTDFIRSAYRGFDALPDKAKALISLYAPLDGMNEKGLCAAVLMINDSDTINQSTGKDDITTTTAIRLLLNKAANVDEALELLQSYDMHASFGYMVHFALADSSGESVIVEYIENETVVTPTDIVTNFYIAEGEKQGIGSSQSHERYEILESTLAENPTMSMSDMRDALDSVSKDNFNEFESTEWSIVYNQSTGEAVYYHREDYGKGYLFKIE